MFRRESEIHRVHRVTALDALRQIAQRFLQTVVRLRLLPEHLEQRLVLHEQSRARLDRVARFGPISFKDRLERGVFFSVDVSDVSVYVSVVRRDGEIGERRLRRQSAFTRVSELGVSFLHHLRELELDVSHGQTEGLRPPLAFREDQSRLARRHRALVCVDRIEAIRTPRRVSSNQFGDVEVAERASSNVVLRHVRVSVAK
mmetsp:Transcript_12330/g.52951  ORF Transcript_12330/g.52951 Transcript_12330/m.52951 type:complete len:201 (+) Transcript_12330:179-781(+)